MKRIMVALAALILLAAPAAASANIPSYVDRSDAKRFARGYWEDDRGIYAPCSHVELSFHPMRPPKLGYVYPGDCTIHLNSRLYWNWSKLCTTVVHEYGHLAGRRHSSDPKSVMYPTWPNPVWGKRFWACDYS